MGRIGPRIGGGFISCGVFEEACFCIAAYVATGPTEGAFAEIGGVSAWTSVALESATGVSINGPVDATVCSLLNATRSVFLYTFARC